MNARTFPFKPFKMYGDIPIPFTLMWKGDKPDFTTIDPAKVAECLKFGLCGICGKPRLGYGLQYWVGGRNGALADGWLNDPPMHKACAEFSLAACPFLSKGKIRDEMDSGDYFLVTGRGIELRGLMSRPKTMVEEKKP